MSAFSFLLNLLWILFGGLWMARGAGFCGYCALRQLTLH